MIGGTRKSRLVPLALTIGLGGCAFCGAIALWIDHGIERDQLAQAARDAAALEPVLAKTYAAVPPLAELTSKPCADQEIRVRWRGEVSTGVHGEPVLWISALADDVLDGWLQGGSKPMPRTEWSWTTSSMLRDIMDPSRNADPAHPGETVQGYVRAIRAQRFLGVFRASSKRLPRIIDDGFSSGGRMKTLEKDKSFASGFFHGWIVVMDLDTAAPVCAAPIDVQSTPTLTYRWYGYRSAKPEDVALDDFKAVFRKASRDAVSRISSLLRLS